MPYNKVIFFTNVCLDTLCIHWLYLAICFEHKNLALLESCNPPFHHGIKWYILQCLTFIKTINYYPHLEPEFIKPLSAYQISNQWTPIYTITLCLNIRSQQFINFFDILIVTRMYQVYPMIYNIILSGSFMRYTTYFSMNKIILCWLFNPE